MPYPSKTSAAEVMKTAADILEREGETGLSIRGLAAELGLAPNALYRYVKDRDALLAGVAEIGSRELLAKLKKAAAGQEPAEALRRVGRAYLDFARKRPALYAVMIRKYPSPEGSRAAHDDLWDFTLDLTAGLVGRKEAPSAAVALWAFLHGIAALSQAQMFDERKPKTGMEYGIEALLAGLKINR